MIRLLYKEATSLISGLLPPGQCGYTDTNIVYACPHWPSANNDPRHHMATHYTCVYL